jgi:hypothetical protein
MKWFKSKLHLFLKQESGSIIVIAALAMVAVIGFTAIVIDGGRLYFERSNLQKAADAGALAGAKELPLDTVKAEEEAENTAEANAVETDIDVETEFGSDQNSITVKVKDHIPLTFARILGFDHQTVSAVAKVQLGYLSSYQGEGVVPLGVDQSHLGTVTYGEPVELKWSENEKGNFGPLVLDGTGAFEYKQDLIDGSDRKIVAGETVLDTQTGAMVGPTIQGLEERFEGDTWTAPSDEDQLVASIIDHLAVEKNNCPRFVLIPVYEPLEDGQVKVTGFATFFITDVGTSNGKATIEGVYLEDYTFPGGTTFNEDYNYGAASYKLVKP